MYTRKVINRLAVLAAMIVLVGVSSAANTALAETADARGETLKTEASPAN